MALSDSELNFLAFSERLESVASDCAEMGKYVRTRFLLDEAEALGIVEPFDGSGSCRHDIFLFDQE